MRRRVRGRTDLAHALLECCVTASTHLALVAEDLGVITPDVDALRDAFGLAGNACAAICVQRRRQNPHLPANYRPNTVAYTGTHDNDTTLGWYMSLDVRPRGGRSHWPAPPDAVVARRTAVSIRRQLRNRAAAGSAWSRRPASDEHAGRMRPETGRGASTGRRSRPNLPPVSGRCCVRPLGLEHDAGERRQRQQQRMCVARGWRIVGAATPRVAQVRASVVRRVRIE